MPPSEVGGVSVECRDVAVGGWTTDTREAGRYSLVEGSGEEDGRGVLAVAAADVQMRMQ